jgi:hypothetical protein
MHREFTIVPEGPFSLRESTEFGFGQRAGQGFTGEMRLAFCLDGYAHQVGVSLTQDDGGVHGTVRGDGDLDRIQGQVARVLSLDISATGFVDLQSIKKIGPFYSSLIVLRGTGFADVLPAKPLAMDHVRRLYGLAADPTPSVLQELAEPWRPYRTWCIVLIRAAADRLLATQETT